MRLRCPDCGLAPIYQSPFRMKRHCSVCGLVFEREQGYFVGAIYINVVVTESLLILTFLAYLVFFSAGDQKVYTALYVLAVTVPVVFFHHSRSLWLSIDHIIDPIRSRIEPDPAHPMS